MRHLWVCLLVAFSACEDLPPLPATFRYEVDFKDDSAVVPKDAHAFVGWAVLAKGQKLGVLTNGEFGPRLTLEAAATTPIETLFEGAQLRSPCGKIVTLSRPIKAPWKDADGTPKDEKKYARSLYKFHLQKLAEKRPGVGPVMSIPLAAHPSEFPGAAVSRPVLIARGGVTDALTIGAMAVDLALTKVEVPFDCGDDLPVKVGGTEIGVWSSKNGATFISLAADACHRDRIVTYGENPFVNEGTLLKGRGVFPLGREPDFFLSKAPTSIGTVEGVKSDTRSELDSAPCP